MKTPDSLAGGEALRLIDLTGPASSGIASRLLAKTAGGSVTLFAFDEGKGLSQHTAPFDGLVLVLDGSLSLTIDGNTVSAAPGTIVRLPANIPHAVDASAPSRMLLIILKD